MFFEKRNCRRCGKQLHGRSDKVFCDDYCRNAFNNTLNKKGGGSLHVRSYINHLKSNRNILERLIMGKNYPIKISKERLLLLGFQFQFHTHFSTEKDGQRTVYCLDYGYRELEESEILIVRDSFDEQYASI
jgi:hypothetical protein